MPPLPEKPKGLGEHPSQNSLEKPQQHDSAEISAVVEGTEISEFIDGEISEELGEDKKKASSGTVSSSGKTTTPVVTSDTSVVLPTLDVMRIQVSTKVKKEILTLEKEATHMMRNPHKFEPFHLNRVVSKIRNLKDILAELAHSTTETVKLLWKKYIKGSKAS